jgi:hypothetical protein
MEKKDAAVISEILEQFKNSNSSQMEFEFRFGEFTKNGFNNNNSAESFYTIKKTFESHYKYEIVNISQESGTLKENDKWVKIRSRKIKNNEECTTKTSLKMHNIYNNNIRADISSEMIISNEKFNSLIKVCENVKCFERKRINFKIDSCLELHLTENSGVFEIELEIVNKKCTIELILRFLNILLQIKQKNFLVIGNNEKTNVLNDYGNMVRNKYFIGAQPETLQMEHLYKINNNNYAITDKADGERTLMFINSYGWIYFIDNNCKNVMKTDIKTDLNCILIDGELVKTKNSLDFWAFDIIFYNKTDLRKSENANLLERLKIIKSLNISNFNTNHYKFDLKKYVFGNISLGISILNEKYKNENVKYSKDGYIFTPINENYPENRKWKNLLKWKPSELNTIDFWVEKDPEVKNGYLLYINDPSSKNENCLELFCPDKSAEEYNNIGNDKNNKFISWDEDVNLDNTIYYKTTFDNSMLDDISGTEFKPKTVIEFKWDGKCFVPLRTRFDKTINNKKWGNNIFVAKDIWKSIKNPVTLKHICRGSPIKESEMGNSKAKHTKTNENSWTNMRKYHNDIKKGLYNKYAGKSKTNLELCSGRGGDLSKWLGNNIEKVIGFDICEKSIQECYSRMKSTQQTPKYEFYKLDLTTNETLNKIKDIVGSEMKFDSICCQFGIHYFFVNENALMNFINICKDHLENSGKIILTFMDSKKVLNFLKNEKDSATLKSFTKYKLSDNGEIEYYFSLEGNDLFVYLNGNNILSKTSKEYLIDFEKLELLLKKENIFLVEKNDFKLENGSQTEKEISNLFSYAVFQKGTSRLPISGVENINVVKYKSELNEIDIDNLKLSIIKNINDLQFLMSLIYPEINIKGNLEDNLYGLQNSKMINLVENKLDILNEQLPIIFIFRNDNDDPRFYIYSEEYRLINLTNTKPNLRKLLKTIELSKLEEQKIEEQKMEQNANEGPSPITVVPLLPTIKNSLKELQNTCKELKIPCYGKKLELLERIRKAMESPL